MLSRNSNSTVTGEENPVGVKGQSLSPDVVQQESTNSVTDLHYSIWRGFTVPHGGVGYGYDRVFASCLDEKLTSVRVEDSYIRSDFQVQNFFRFCELLDRKCKNLKRITLITANEGQNFEAKIEKKVKPTLGDRLHFDYKNFHDRKVDFDNGWRVMLGRGLDYFHKLADPSSGNADDMNRRTCKATTITIRRDETNVSADLRSAPFESRISGDYTIQAVIGRGGFGVVFKTQHKLDERPYAIKRINVADTEQSRNKVLGEVRLMAPLDHPHIVRYYDAWLERPPPGWQQEHDDNLLRELRSRRRQQNGKENNVSPDPEDVTQTETELLAPGSMVLVSENGRIITVGASEITNQIRANDMNKKDAYPMVDSKLAYLYIKMEFCCGPTLHKWLGQNRLPEQRPISQTLGWFRQLVSAVKYIHDAGLIHRDIKPGNIFFGSSRDGAAPVLKIGDLGLAIDMALSSSSGVSDDVSKSLSIVGTPIYMSPEQPSGRYTNSTDIFSLGLVFLEMVHPFKTDMERYVVFGALRSKQRYAVMNKLDKEMGAIIRRMTALEPKIRPTANELDNELKKTTAERPPESANETGAGPHAETNGGTDSNVKSEVGTSLLVAIAPVDEAGSPASKRLKSDLSSEVRISRSGTPTVSSSEHPDIGGPSVDDGVSEGINFTELLPLKLTLKIFRYLYEDDLAQCTLVSRKFRTIANHQILWKLLYQEVFEYSLPLLHVGHAQFEFRKPHDWPQPRSDESIVVNPWKESFKQLRSVQALQKDGVHVRPGYALLYSGFGTGGRRLTQCDRLDQALQLIEARGKNAEKLIFLHTGLYILETTVTINSDIQIIGASAGPGIASRVIIEGRRTKTVVLREDSQGAYLGWITVRFAPDSGAEAAAIAAGNPRASTHHCALQICDDSTALVEHCVIHSSATVGAAVYVHGSETNPKMRHCVVCDCEREGIHVTDEAQGQFEDCEIARNNLPGILVANHANPFFRWCHIHDGRSSGIFTFDHGMGYFESCNIHNNRLSGIEVRSAANPTVTHCEVRHGQAYGVYVHKKGRGQFMENRIHSNELTDIAIESHSDPIIRRNKIYNGLQDGICIFGEGRGLIEKNEVYGNTFAGISVATGSSPIIRKNRIHSGKQAGVYFCDNGQGVLEDNEIFDNAMAGIWIETDGNPTLRRNRIYDGRDKGVYIFNKGRGVLEDNDIYRNALAGIEIASHSDPKITRNKIRGNQKGGAIIHNNGQGLLEDNEIFDNVMPGVRIETDGNPMLRRNKIYNGREEGVLISNKGRGVLEDNDIYRNAQAGVLILFESNPTLTENRVYEGRTTGIEIREGAMATLESNDIFHNRFGGLCMAAGVRPTLCYNKIYDNDLALQ